MAVMTIKQRLKNFFTKKPKTDFWMSAFITLVLFRWVTPTVMQFYVFLQMGLIAPELDFTPIMEKASKKLAESFLGIMQRMFEIGQGIALENPLTAKILFHLLSYFVWIIYVAMIILILNLVRYGTSWLIRKYAKPKLNEGDKK